MNMFAHKIQQENTENVFISLLSPSTPYFFTLFPVFPAKSLICIIVFSLILYNVYIDATARLFKKLPPC